MADNEISTSADSIKDEIFQDNYVKKSCKDGYFILFLFVLLTYFLTSHRHKRGELSGL